MHTEAGVRSKADVFPATNRHFEIAAAIVDHALADGDSSEICERLRERNVPFVTYSGFANVEGACAEAEHVNKPASPSVLVATVTGLLASRPISN